MTIRAALKPFFTAQFLKFAMVGASGVVVNLVGLGVFHAWGARASVASALAIQVSIVSNFLVNEFWTFREQRATAGSTLGRAARFQLVSLLGAVLQWLVFIVGNVALLRWVQGEAAWEVYAAGADGWFERWLYRPVVDPPQVGWWIYVSQLAGIAASTGWNFLANFHWTWGDRT